MIDKVLGQIKLGLDWVRLCLEEVKFLARFRQVSVFGLVYIQSR